MFPSGIINFFKSSINPLKIPTGDMIIISWGSSLGSKLLIAINKEDIVFPVPTLCISNMPQFVKPHPVVGINL